MPLLWNEHIYLKIKKIILQQTPSLWWTKRDKYCVFCMQSLPGEESPSWWWANPLMEHVPGEPGPRATGAPGVQLDYQSPNLDYVKAQTYVRSAPSVELLILDMYRSS